MFGIELLALLLTSVALTAQVHWERVPTANRMVDIAVRGDVLVGLATDGRLIAVVEGVEREWAPATPTSRVGSRLSTTSTGAWVVDDNSGYAQLYDGSWHTKIQVPVAFPTNVSEDGQGRLWASGLHGTLAVREGGQWRNLHVVDGNLLVVGISNGAWVWTSEGGGEVLRLSGDGEIVERRQVSPWIHQVAATGVFGDEAFGGGPDGFFLGAERQLDGEVLTGTVAPDVVWAYSRGDAWRVVGGREPEPVPVAEDLVKLAAIDADLAYGLGALGVLYHTVTGEGPWFRDASEAWGTGSLNATTSVSDLDGDGDDDLVSLDASDGDVRAWLQRDGRFVAGPNFPPVAFVPATVTAECDFDGNGLSDPVLTEGIASNGFGVQLLLNRGRFDDVTERSGLGAHHALAADRAACGDVDGDGDADLWFLRGGQIANRSVSLFLNDGRGFFAAAALADRSLDQPDFVRAVHPADLNGDTFMDFVFVNLWGRGHSVLAGSEGGLRDVSRASGLRTVYDVPFSSWLVDYDADGALDLITASPEVVNVWKGDALRFEVATPPALASLSGNTAASPLTRTGGGQDLVVCGASGCQWHDLNSGHTDRGLALPDIPAASGLRAIDLGRDGDTDLLVTTQAGTFLWENRARTQPVGPAPRAAFSVERRLRWMSPTVDLPSSIAVVFAWMLAVVATRRAGSQREAGNPLVAAAGVTLWAAGALLLADEVTWMRLGWAGANVGVALTAQAASVVVARARQTRRLAGYRLGPRIGAGGMGTVYVATDENTGEVVALKLVNPDMLQTEEDRLMYRREAEIGASIEHRGVVKIQAFGEVTILEEDGWPRVTAWLAMELLDGESLDGHCRRRGPLPVGEACAIVSEVCDALMAIHQLDVVHRDVKPANVMLVPDGLGAKVVLMDFGAARHVGQLTEGARSVLGTLGYLAPEQGHGEPPMPGADVYACGVMLYELLSGHRPFDEPDLVTLMAKVFSAPPPPLDVEVSPELQALVNLALEKKPEDRIRSARALKEALEPWVTRVPMPMGRATPLRRNTTQSTGLRQAAGILLGYLRGESPTHAPPTIAPPRETNP